MSRTSYTQSSGKRTLLARLPTRLMGLLFVLVITGCNSDNASGPLFEQKTNAALPKSVGYGTLPSTPLADENFLGDHFSGSGSCAVCHNNIVDDTDTDRSIGTAWETSSMANSARDPYWRAKSAATIKNHPDLVDKVNDTCTRCHAPMANEAARRDGVKLDLFSATIDQSNTYFDHAMDGVSCTLCHQIEDTGSLGTVASGSGNFVIATLPPGTDRENRPAYGKYADPVGAYMTANAEFSPKHGPHMGSSEMCATCHDLKTPKLDGDGHEIPDVIENYFQEQQTFTEWKNSDYRDGGTEAATCQACHMPRIDTTITLASSGTDLRRANFSEHTFLGANTFILDVFKNFKNELGIKVDGFDQAIERNRAFLKTAADIAITDVKDAGDNMVVKLKIQNNTGHKLPSGYPSRRVFVNLVVTDITGAVIFESGRLNDDGSIDGNDGDSNYNLHEPHYNTIRHENQVLIYEAVMADYNGKVTHSLVEGVRYQKDNRLTPKGFDKTLVDNDVAVIGAAAQDANFNTGIDFFEYVVPTPTSGDYFIIADLIYQPLSFGHVEYLFKDTDIPEVDNFKTMYDATDLKTETISSAIEVHSR